MPIGPATVPALATKLILVNNEGWHDHLQSCLLGVSQVPFEIRKFEELQGRQLLEMDCHAGPWGLLEGTSHLTDIHCPVISRHHNLRRTAATALHGHHINRKNRFHKLFRFHADIRLLWLKFACLCIHTFFTYVISKTKKIRKSRNTVSLHVVKKKISDHENTVCELLSFDISSYSICDQ